MECLVWYLKSSKRGNDRVTSFQETSKKLPEDISDLKKATSIDSARSSGTGKSPLGYLCHLTFDFWASLCYPLREFFCHLAFAICFTWSVISGWLGSGLVWLLLVWACRLIWVCRYLVQTAQAKMWSASSKVPHPIWEHFGKNFIWLVNL